MDYMMGIGICNSISVGGGGGGNYCAEYKLIKSAMTIQPSSIDAAVQNTLIKYLVDNGYYAKAELIDVFATHDGGQVINWANPGTFTPLPVNSPVFTAYGGYKGSSVGAKYVNLKFNPAVDGVKIDQNDICVIIAFGDADDSTDYDFGSQNAATSYLLIQAKSAGVTNYFCNDKTSQSIANAKKEGHYVMSRGDAGTYHKGKNLTFDVSTVTSIAPTDRELYATARNTGTPSISNSEVRYAMLFSYLNEYEIRDIIGCMEEYLRNYDTNLIINIIAYSVNSTKEKLSIPTSVIDNDECLHPGVVDCGYVWNGYRYWMVCTPYPYGDRSYENPEVFGSNDGIYWQVPFGVVNPILPKNPLVGPGTSAYSDPDLFFENNTLYITYRSTEVAGRSQLRQIKTTDGKTWNIDSPAILHDSSVAGALIGGGSLIKIDGVYYYYGEWGNTDFGLMKLVRISSNTIDGTYSNTEGLTVTFTSNTSHLCIYKSDSAYYLATAENITNNKQITMRKSVDGVTFTNEDLAMPLVYNTKIWEDPGVIYKRPYLCKVDGVLYCYYSVENSTGVGTYIARQAIALI